MRNYSNDLKLFSKIKQSDGMLNYSQIIRKIYLSICLIGLALAFISFI